MKKIVAARAADVDYCQKQILNFEKELPQENQVLTRFKIYQKHGRDQEEISDLLDSISDSDPRREDLISKEKGHVRKFVDDELPVYFLVFWIAIIIISIFEMTIKFWVS